MPDKRLVGIFYKNLSRWASQKWAKYCCIRNKRSQAKGVYYVFLYKQQLDNVYTRVAIHRFTLSPLHTVAHGCWAPTLSAPPFFS